MTAILKCNNGWYVCCLLAIQSTKASNASPNQWKNSMDSQATQPTHQKVLQLGERQPPFNGWHHPHSSQQNEVTLLVFLPSPLPKSSPTTTSGPQSVQRTPHAAWQILALQHNHHRMSCCPRQPSPNVQPPPRRQGAMITCEKR